MNTLYHGHTTKTFMAEDVPVPSTYYDLVLIWKSLMHEVKFQISPKPIGGPLFALAWL
jgi:hypothetical protein